MRRQFSAPGLCAIAALLACPAALAHPRKPVQVPQVFPAEWLGESGAASWYGAAQHGHRTASGSRFNPQELTAAHRWLPFGTRVRVTLAGSDRTVIVVVTDRLYSSSRVVDLSQAAARLLGMLGRGVAMVFLAPV